MKKIICTLLVCCALVLVGCGSAEKKTADYIGDHIIEVRNNIYMGQDDTMYATFCSGEREEPYDLDGVVNEKVPFGIITLSRHDNCKLSNDEYMFTIIINGESSSGTLTKSPYDNTYSADIEKAVDDNAEISLEVDINGKVFSQTLYNESKDFAINQSKAIEIAASELSSALEDMQTSDRKTAEAMIKILKDYSGETNRYFWYVGLIGADGKTAGVLIDAQTGEVVSVKL